MTSISDVGLDVFSGPHFDMGFQQGKLYKQRIDEMWNIANESTSSIKPMFLPKSLFFWIAKRRATRMYKKLIERYATRQAERIRGISEGSNTDLKTLYMYQAEEANLGPRCTSIGILPEKSSTGDVLMGRNFDLFRSLIPSYVGRRNKPKDRFLNIDFGLCSFAGNFHGMNEKGLAITYNYALPTDEFKPGVPPSILIQEALENCATTKEAVKIFQDNPKGNGAILLVGDASGDIQTVEMSCNRLTVRQPQEGFIINTNHYLTDEMKPIDIKEKELRESTEKRYDRAERLLSDASMIDEETLQEILKDHGPDGKPGCPFTICRHGDPIGTTMSLVFNLNKRIMSVAIGNPCQSQFKKFEMHAQDSNRE